MISFLIETFPAGHSIILQLYRQTFEIIACLLYIYSMRKEYPSCEVQKKNMKQSQNVAVLTQRQQAANFQTVLAVIVQVV